MEQNFDFDLLTPAKLMEKAVGQDITIVRVNPATGAETREQALVLATNGGVVLKIGQRIEVLRDDGLPVRVIFDKVPDNLRARPTLSVSIVGAHAGLKRATLSYLTPGLGWKADYVALYNESDCKIDVQGWVTLTNSSGTTYDNAQTLLVAGSPSSNGGQSENYRPPVRRQTLQRPGTESGTPRAIGRLLPLSSGRTHHHRQFANQAGELSRRAWRPRRARLRISQSLAGNRGNTAERAEHLQFFDQRACRTRRSAAGRHVAFLHEG